MLQKLHPKSWTPKSWVPVGPVGPPPKVGPPKPDPPDRTSRHQLMSDTLNPSSQMTIKGYNPIFMDDEYGWEHAYYDDTIWWDVLWEGQVGKVNIQKSTFPNPPFGWPSVCGRCKGWVDGRIIINIFLCTDLVMVREHTYYDDADRRVVCGRGQVGKSMCKSQPSKTHTFGWSSIAEGCVLWCSCLKSGVWEGGKWGAKVNMETSLIAR